MIVGVMQFEIYMHSSRSLKEKRRVIKSLTEKVKSKFKNLSISEVGSLNLWKKSEIAVAIVSNDIKIVNSNLDRVLNFVSENGSYEIISSNIEVIKF
ncbi:MAG: DUF503 domain-containing protein [Thermodesulfobacteriota bacterium]